MANRQSKHELYMCVCVLFFINIASSFMEVVVERAAIIKQLVAAVVEDMVLVSYGEEVGAKEYIDEVVVMVVEVLIVKCVEEGA